jgi:catechol 2,3-dioxygenase-like lactoylglutathione lyase family enzyme
MAATALTHLAICVGDIDRSLTFYRDLLGFRVIADWVQQTTTGGKQHTFKTPHPTQRAAVMFFGEKDEGPMIVLEQNPGSGPDGKPIMLDQIGITHLSFQVPNLAEMTTKLLAAGVQTCGPANAFANQSGHVGTVFFKDPDGIVIQLDEGMSRQGVEASAARANIG